MDMKKNQEKEDSDGGQQTHAKPPPTRPVNQKPPPEHGGGGVPDTSNGLRRGERGAAQDPVNDPMDPRCERGDVYSTLGHRCSNIPSDTPVRQRSRVQRSSCFHTNLGSGDREQEQVQGAV
jgi:hypothetical protein